VLKAPNVMAELVAIVATDRLTGAVGRRREWFLGTERSQKSRHRL